MNNIRIIFLLTLILSKGISYGQFSMMKKNTKSSKTANVFQYFYKNIAFTCRELNDSNVSIINFDSRAKTVEFPTEVTDLIQKKSYHVMSIDTHDMTEPLFTEEIIINEGIVNIEKKCFFNFKNLNKVVLPSSLQWIDKKAFANMSNPFNIEFTTTEVKDLLVLSGIKYNCLAEPKARQKKEEKTESEEKESVQYKVAVVKVISFVKTDALSARINQRIDNNSKLCALVKIVINGNANYSSDYLPEPAKNFIAYNKEGYDYVWLTTNATSLDIYSDNRKFEPATLDFKQISNGTIPTLESGVVYELKLRIVHEQ